MLKGINDLELECIENAICLESTEYASNIKVNIPKLMPLIDVDKPTKKNIIINRNILLNDIGSIPDIEFRVETSNYIELPMGVPSKLNSGDSVLVLIPNKNIKKMKIINL